jgi:hypothetical protein
MAVLGCLALARIIMPIRDTPYTGLLRYILANDGRTNRAVKLVFAVAVAVMVPLVLVATVAALAGPAAAAITGGVPLGVTVLGTAVGAARTRLRRSRQARRS